MAEFTGGYRSAEGFDLASSALIVVDMTNDFGHPDGAYAKHGSSCEPLEAIVPKVSTLIKAVRAAGRPVILVSQVVFTDTAGRAISAPGLTTARPWIVEEGLRSGTWGTSMLDGLPEADIVIEKHRASGFTATALDLLLRGIEIDTVIVVGGFTNQCVESTVRDAWALDYRVMLPPDGSAAFDPRLHDATLETLAPLSVQLGVDELVERLGSVQA